MSQVEINKNTRIRSLHTLARKTPASLPPTQESAACARTLNVSLDKKLALFLRMAYKKRQAIIWTKDVQFNYAFYMRHSASLS